jgi:hypothetical protein
MHAELLLENLLLYSNLEECEGGWEVNIKMDLQEIGGEDGRGMELDHDHVQCWALILRVESSGSHAKE